MNPLTLLEASQELRRQARALIAHKPVPVEIIQDLERTAERIRKHTDHLVGWRADLSCLSNQLSQLGAAAFRPSARDPLEEWRLVALEFPCIQDCLRRKLLYPGFEPFHLARLRKDTAALTPSMGSVLGFLLHISNHARRFDLAEVQRWDDLHRAAFQRWVTGQSTGQLCRYFLESSRSEK